MEGNDRPPPLMTESQLKIQIQGFFLENTVVVSPPVVVLHLGISSLIFCLGKKSNIL